MELFPPIPLADWRDTKETLHRFCQVVGKLRLAASVRRNHWWNVPFHLTGRGITTRPMGLADGNPIFTIDFDFVDHQLRIHTLDGRGAAFPLQGQSVASFHRDVFQALDRLGVKVDVAIPRPFDLPDADRRFADDIEHASYDPAWASRYWQVLSQVNLVLEEFAARFAGKVSPVHHFWHTFDIAHTRFADRNIDQPPTADPVSREAYSREVISFGFWFGDDHFPEPAFYAYTAPEPAGLAGERLAPRAARWESRNGSHLAVLAYDDARAAGDPRGRVLDFYESAYQAGPGGPAGTSSGWPALAGSPTRTCADPTTRLGRSHADDIHTTGTETANSARPPTPASTRFWTSCAPAHPGRLEAGPAGPVWNGSIGDLPISASAAVSWVVSRPLACPRPG
jgi:hypothetical protein